MSIWIWTALVVAFATGVYVIRRPFVVFPWVPAIVKKDDRFRFRLLRFSLIKFDLDDETEKEVSEEGNLDQVSQHVRRLIESTAEFDMLLNIVLR